MMWGGTSQYMPESGYSTQAPSISGSIDQFGQQMDNTMGANQQQQQCSMETNVVSNGAQNNEWNYNKQQYAQQQQVF